MASKPVTSTIQLFSPSIQKTDILLNDVLNEFQDLGWGEDKHKAYHALRCVLHSLRDRLPPEENAHFAAQLPLLLKGTYFDGWNPGSLCKTKNMEEFKMLMDMNASGSDYIRLNAERVAHGTFKVLGKHIDVREIAKIREMLPEHLKNALIPQEQMPVHQK